MANQAYQTVQSGTGVCTFTQAASPQSTWNLCYLSVSMAGPTIGPNAKLTIYDGSVATGTAMFSMFLTGPVVPGMPTGGSVGYVQEIPLPMSPQGQRGIQASPGNALTVQVTGTGGNQVIINARISDDIP